MRTAAILLTLLAIGCTEVPSTGGDDGTPLNTRGERCEATFACAADACAAEIQAQYDCFFDGNDCEAEILAQWRCLDDNGCNMTECDLSDPMVSPAGDVTIDCGSDAEREILERATTAARTSDPADVDACTSLW